MVRGGKGARASEAGGGGQLWPAVARARPEAVASAAHPRQRGAARQHELEELGGGGAARDLVAEAEAGELEQQGLQRVGHRLWQRQLLLGVKVEDGEPLLPWYGTWDIAALGRLELGS